MPDVKQAGYYKLNKFLIKGLTGGYSRDLIGVVFKFNIVESMSAGFIKGSAVIFESLNILRNLKGQEILEVEYEDFFGNVQTGQYVVYAIDNIGYGDAVKPGFMQYTLYFVSPYKFFSENYRVEKGYRDQKISDYVRSVFQEFMADKVSQSGYQLREKTIDIEPTENMVNVLVPKMSPENTMHFLSRNAYTNINPLGNGEASQTFRFFEARDKFYFCTNEKMKTLVQSDLVTGRGNSLDPQRSTASYTRNYYGNLSPDTSQAVAMSNIITLSTNARVNTMETIMKGGYKRKVYELDIRTMNIKSQSYDYTSERNNSVPLAQDEAFINQYMSKEKEIFIIQDWELSNDPHFKEIYTRKPMYFYNQEKSSIDISVYGRNDIFAGSIININVLVNKAADGSAPEPDESLSGEYLVETSESLFDGNIYTQKLKLVRGGGGGQ